jgi:hypothetical protein
MFKLVYKIGYLILKFVWSTWNLVIGYFLPIFFKKIPPATPANKEGRNKAGRPVAGIEPGLVEPLVV